MDSNARLQVELQLDDFNLESKLIKKFFKTPKWRKVGFGWEKTLSIKKLKIRLERAKLLSVDLSNGNDQMGIQSKSKLIQSIAPFRLDVAKFMIKNFFYTTGY